MLIIDTRLAYEHLHVYTQIHPILLRLLYEATLLLAQEINI